jgi:hypothetical protein
MTDIRPGMPRRHDRRRMGALARQSESAQRKSVFATSGLRDLHPRLRRGSFPRGHYIASFRPNSSVTRRTGGNGATQQLNTAMQIARQPHTPDAGRLIPAVREYPLMAATACGIRLGDVSEALASCHRPRPICRSELRCSDARRFLKAGVGPPEDQTSVCSAISRASSTSMPR